MNSIDEDLEPFAAKARSIFQLDLEAPSPALAKRLDAMAWRMLEEAKTRSRSAPTQKGLLRMFEETLLPMFADDGEYDRSFHHSAENYVFDVQVDENDPDEALVSVRMLTDDDAEYHVTVKYFGHPVLDSDTEDKKLAGHFLFSNYDTSAHPAERGYSVSYHAVGKE